MRKIEITKKAPTNDDTDFAASAAGLPAVADDIMDLANCLGTVIDRANERNEHRTFGPTARQEIRQALEHLRRAACAALVNPAGLKCPNCGAPNGHGFTCGDCIL